MGEVKWPAIAIQSIFLAANIAFFLNGKTNSCILISFTLIMVLFSIQSLSLNVRFWYLFPINSETGISTVGYDTYILRVLLILSILFFYMGVTNKYLLALIIVGIPLCFSLIWDKFIEQRHRKFIKNKKESF